MKYTTIVVALMALWFTGCAPDDQVFNISALTPEHQLIFLTAMDDLNSRKPDAVFKSSPDGISAVGYGQPASGAIAITYPPTLWNRGWYILFSIDILNYKSHLLRISTHELCHVLNVEHGEGNPQGSHC